MNKYEVRLLLMAGGGLKIEKVEATRFTWDEHCVSFFHNRSCPHASYDAGRVVSVVLVEEAHE